MNHNNGDEKLWVEPIAEPNRARILHSGPPSGLANSIRAFRNHPEDPRLHKRLLDALMVRRDEPLTPELLEALLDRADDPILYWLLDRREAGVDTWEIDGRLPSGLFTPLTKMITRNEPGGYEFVEFLLKQGADPNQRSRSGYTPINQAKPSMISILLEAGADPFHPEPINHTTIFSDVDKWLHPSARPAMLRALKQANRMNNTYPGSQTPLFIWFVSQVREIVKLNAWQVWVNGVMDFLSQGVDLDVQDPVTGNTALHTLLHFYPSGDATNMYLDRCISELIHRGARMDIENNKGKTAGDMIRKKRNRHLQDIIDRAMPAAAAFNAMNVSSSSSSSSSSSALGKRRLPRNGGGGRRRKTRQRKRPSRSKSAIRRAATRRHPLSK